MTSNHPSKAAGIVAARWLLCAVLVPACLAEGAEPAASTPPTAPSENPLAGPKVEPSPESVAAKPRTLVEREFDGRLKRLDTNPAIAALDLIELSPTERESADAVIFERNAVLDRVVRNHLKDITLVAAAAQSGDKAGALRLLKPIIEETSELRARGRLVDELAEFLPKEKATELKRLNREYWRAAVDDRMRLGDADEPDKKLNSIQASAHEMVLAVGEEIRRSYERTFGLEAKEFEDLIKRLGLSPEQESKVRAVVTDMFQQSYGKPSKAKSTAAFLKVYGMLDAGQREILLRQIRKDGGYSGAPTGDGATPKPAPGKDDVPVPKSDPMADPMR